MCMSRRIQIVVAEDEMQEFRRAASSEGLPLSEWARRAMRRARQQQSGPSASQKLSALEKALRCGYPTGEMDTMLREIEEGRDLR